MACRTLHKHCKLDMPALVPAYRLQGTLEWLRGHPAEAEKCWEMSLAHAEKLGACYEEALMRLEIGCRRGDRDQLEAGGASFAEMGAAWDLAEAPRLLAGYREVVGEAVLT